MPLLGIRLRGSLSRGLLKGTWPGEFLWLMASLVGEEESLVEGGLATMVILVGGGCNILEVGPGNNIRK